MYRERDRARETHKIDKWIYIQTQTHIWGLSFSMYAPRGNGWCQAFHTFPLRITCKKGVGGSR